MRPARVRPRTASTARFTSSKTSARVRAWSSFALKSIGHRTRSSVLRHCSRAFAKGLTGVHLARSMVRPKGRVNTTDGKTNETFIRAHTDGGVKPIGLSDTPAWSSPRSITLHRKSDHLLRAYS